MLIEMEVLSRSAIEQWIVPLLPVKSRGFKPTVPLYPIVQAILYRLKTGCQWRQLPIT
jgi:transposase